MRPTYTLSLVAGLASVAAFDFLFWHRFEFGLNAVLFMSLLGACAIAVFGQITRKSIKAAAVWLLSLLPLLELVQPLSLAWAVGGSFLALCILIKPADASWTGTAGRMSLRWWGWPFADAIKLPVQALSHMPRLSRIADWIFPVIGVILFGILFGFANPFLELGLAQFFAFEWLASPNWGRILAWLLVFVWIWPAYTLAQRNFAKKNPTRSKQVSAASQDRADFIALILSPKALFNALLVFNLIFALQTTTDAVFLFGYSGLPAGWTYAEYAHGGAYPLVAVCLLAAVFALLIFSRLKSHGLAKTLLLIWVVQTGLLLATSAFRLGLYVDAYGLTLLRLSAAVWMALVGFGILSLLATIYKDAPIRRLLKVNVLASLTVLYLTCFVDYGAIIARHNITAFERGEVKRIDQTYLTILGNLAHYEVLRKVQAGTLNGDKFHYCNSLESGWRGWQRRHAQTRAKRHSLTDTVRCD